MADEFTVRRYRPTDHEPVVRLHERAMREAGAYSESADDADLDDVRGTYLAGRGSFVVGVAGDAVVATGAFRPATGYMQEFLPDVGPATATLKRMRVAPDRQRRGYGTGVLRDLERRAREQGFERLVLDTTSRQDAARQFYEARGFTEQRRVTATLGEERFELCCYSKQL